MKTIAISNTIPSEVVYAAGYRLVDLNNTFVTSNACEAWIESAEYEGFPKSMCAWIKGVYSACMSIQPDYFIGVTEGDCSNTKGLIEVLNLKGIQVLPFAYPQDLNLTRMTTVLEAFMSALEITEEQVTETWHRLNRIRALGVELDRLTYETNQVTGFENHLRLVSFSDFNGNPEVFEEELIEWIKEVSLRPARPVDELRLAYIGVPPMVSDLYDYTESQGARVVFNEVQREFSMPRYASAQSLAHQYLDYTYPYDMPQRLEHLKAQLELREIDGIIHYTQAFCHRALDDLVFKHHFDWPILTLEGDKAGNLDGRSKLRLEAFIDMLREGKRSI